MAANATDHRAHKTRAQILDAFARLLTERAYDELTVQDVLDRAQVGRTTFYGHFRSKEELLRCSLDRLKGGLAEAGRQRKLDASDQPVRLAFALPFIQHVTSHGAVYQSFVGRDSFVVLERYMRRMLSDLVRDDLLATAMQPPTQTMEVAVQHVVGGLWSVVIWWLERRVAMPADELHAMFERLSLPGLDVLADARASSLSR